MTDFQNFAQGARARYSGRYAGYPFVRFYGIWNESNLGQFLSPQFNASGAIVSPAAYAKLAAAGYAGIKAGNAKALVAHRRDLVERPGQAESRRDRLGLARACSPSSSPRPTSSLKFDAWAHHPYPYPVNQKPTPEGEVAERRAHVAAAVRDLLDTWFHRKNIPVWITEYGHETKPGEPIGVTEASRPRT